MPPREALYEKLNSRCAQMFATGLIEEVRQILDRGWPASAKPFESHGYRQALQILSGELTPEQALIEAQTNTRRYAKRQMTWFRKESGVEWLCGFGDDPVIQQTAIDQIRLFIAPGVSAGTISVKD
jgi:tRNA dimethylallyltransferase